MSQRDSKIESKVFPHDVIIPEILKVLDEGHTVTIGLRGNSMRPFLRHCRDKALLRKNGAVKRGDTVLAEVGRDRYVLHRIIKIVGSEVTLLGDGNIQCEYCDLGDVKAVVSGFYRKGRQRLDSTGGWKWKLYSFVWMNLPMIVRRIILKLTPKDKI